MMTSKPSVAIVGGGPAGLTAAVILNRAGYVVRVYEGDKSQQQRSQGGTLDLHPDSWQIALSRASLLDKFNAIARHEDQEERIIDPLTGEVTLLDRTEGSESKNRPEIDRGTLRKLLFDALPPDVVLWDHHLSYMDLDEGEKYELVFTN